MKWIVREGECRRRMHVIGLAKDSVPEKTSGMHRCIPECSDLFEKSLISSSWLSSSLPFYSPHFLNSRASVAGGARIQSSCIDSPNYLVKRKVIGDGEKVRHAKIVAMTAREVAEDVRAAWRAEKGVARHDARGFGTSLGGHRTRTAACKAQSKRRA